MNDTKEILIAFLSSIVNDDKEKTKHKLRAAELIGLLEGLLPAAE